MGHNTTNKHRKTLKVRKKQVDRLQLVGLEDQHDTEVWGFLPSQISWTGLCRSFQVKTGTDKKSLQRKPLLFYQYLPNSSQNMHGKDSPLAWPLKFQQTQLRFESFTLPPLHSTEAGGMLWFSHLVVSAGLCGSCFSIPCQTELGGADCPTWVPLTVNWFFISCLAKTGCIPIPPPG